MKNKIVNKEELVLAIQKLKEDKKKVVSTSGCFDILHAGHVTYLDEARKMGDVLVVFLNSDSSVKSLKGETRPIVSQDERALVIAALESVDYVILFDEKTPCEMIDMIKPDVVIKGGDYAGMHIPEMDYVRKYGGVVKYVTMVDNCSSTNIIEKIRGMK